MRMVGRIALLVALWLLAWGDVSVANVLSGIAVAGMLLVAFPPGPRAGSDLRLSPAGAARLGLHVFTQLVSSNVGMAREILRRRPRTHSGVLAHRLQRPSEEVVTLMSSVIALSPGTMTVDVSSDSTTIYVHFLLLRDEEAARASLRHLEQLSADAILAPEPVRPDGATTAPEDTQ